MFGHFFMTFQGVEEVHELTCIDRWFLSKLYGLHRLKDTLRGVDFHQLRNSPVLLRAPFQVGFSSEYHGLGP